MNGEEVNFITDTGCPTTIINRETFLKLNISLSDNDIRHQVTTSNGSKANVLNKWKGPYTVEKILNEIDYVVRPDKWKGRRTIIHRNNLKKCILRRVVENTPKIEGLEQDIKEKVKEKKSKGYMREKLIKMTIKPKEKTAKLVLKQKKKTNKKLEKMVKKSNKIKKALLKKKKKRKKTKNKTATALPSIESTRVLRPRTN